MARAGCDDRQSLLTTRATSATLSFGEGCWSTGVRVPVLGLLLLSVTLLACDRTESFPFENATDVRVYVTITADGEGVGVSLGPGAVEGIVTGERFWTGRVLARDDDGNIVFDEQISWEELNRRGRVVITRTSE